MIYNHALEQHSRFQNSRFLQKIIVNNLGNPSVSAGRSKRQRRIHVSEIFQASNGRRSCRYRRVLSRNRERWRRAALELLNKELIFFDRSIFFTCKSSQIAFSVEEESEDESSSGFLISIFKFFSDIFFFLHNTHLRLRACDSYRSLIGFWTNWIVQDDFSLYSDFRTEDTCIFEIFSTFSLFAKLALE